MYQFPSDWLTVYADHRVVFTYPKFVEAIGKFIDDIGFVDLFPEPLRVYLQMRYKEFPPSIGGCDLYLQRFPPLDVQILGLPRYVDASGNIGETIGELKLLGTITVFCSTARELKIETVYDPSAPRRAQEVIIALGEKINACIDDANAHPEQITSSAPAIPPAPTAQPATAKSRRGGPPPTPQEDKLKYINEWKKAQENGEKQETYCARVGIGASTLRMWMRELEPS
ncbi:hypothetical protein FBQ82_04785 [Anaerolineae bacterium CFX7]|nr:hypothetical protein [Anaerolineae bacterium CFX7]